MASTHVDPPDRVPPSGLRPPPPESLDPSLTRFWGVAENGDAYEVAIRPHLVDELIERWPAHALERRTELTEPLEGRIGLGATWAIIPDVEESSDHPSQDAWDILSQALTVFAAQRVTRLVTVHAAVFVWNGRAIIVPAHSEAGKSELAVAAGAAGATVITDEYALLDPATGLTQGWTRPARVYRDDKMVHLDIVAPSEPVPVGLVAFVEHDPALAGEEPALRWEPLTPAQTVLELLAHTICARRRPNASTDAALAVAQVATGIRGTRGEASDAIGELLALADELSAPEGSNLPD